MKRLCKITLLFILLFSANAAFAQTESELEKGIEAYNQGEYQKAADTLQKIVEADEKNRKAWLYLGMSYANLKNNSKAVKAFKKADKISDEDTDGVETRVKIVSKPRPNYTDEARQNMTQGIIKLAIEFGADGKIKAVAAFQVLADGLTRQAIQAAQKIRFEPAAKDGKAYSTIGIVAYTFTIY